MHNTLLLLASLPIYYGLVIGWFFLFGIRGLMCWVVIASIAANIEVMVLVDAFGMSQTLGNVMFASTFLTTDILSETASKKIAQKAVNIGVMSSISFILISQVWLCFEPNSSDQMFPHIQAVFSNTPRIMIAGLVVYATVQHFDVWAYHQLWKITEKFSGSKKKYLWFRNNTSTLISQMLNTSLFSVLAFAGTYDTDTIISIALTGYIIFIFTSLTDTPFLYLARAIHTKRC